MGGVLVKNNDKPPEESILLNQPLDSSDHGKLLIFSMLMVPSVVFLVGVLPVIFLALGIYMMKKNKHFSSIDTAVLYTNNYFKFLKIFCGIGSILFVLIVLTMERKVFHSGELFLIILMPLVGLPLGLKLEIIGANSLLFGSGFHLKELKKQLLNLGKNLRQSPT